MYAFKKSFPIVIICTIFSCNNVNTIVTENAAVPYFTYPVSHEISGFEHYIYLGNSKKVDSALFLEVAKAYTDTVKADCPVFAIIFLNKLKSFPRTLDDQDWGAIRKSYLFEISYNEDSLKVGKYVINQCYHWSGGERVD